ncbi:unnamed protein product, partial [Ceratitis capitata]
MATSHARGKSFSRALEKWLQFACCAYLVLKACEYDLCVLVAFGSGEISYSEVNFSTSLSACDFTTSCGPTR